MRNKDRIKTRNFGKNFNGGTNFLSGIFKNTCRLLKNDKIQTIAYHSKSNDALERSHRTLPNI